MKFKLDENFGSRTARLFSEAGHEVETVLEEKLSGATDDIIFEACAREGRCLLTLDIDFADVLRFPPHRTAGIAVLRLPKGPSSKLLEQFVMSLLRMLTTESIMGRLWIIGGAHSRSRERRPCG